MIPKYARFTLPKTKISPENRPTNRKCHLPTIHFRGRAVTFRERTSFKLNLKGDKVRYANLQNFTWFNKHMYFTLAVLYQLVHVSINRIFLSDLSANAPAVNFDPIKKTWKRSFPAIFAKFYWKKCR